ncbi:hypothetical protein OJ997_07950 [Solirubrobacter phytolaccae]|uniref:Uncharacterized protein n=1 Tax=Solirubrobacter phytolaccae TaxID=1404360 RepID=A0A9X3N5R4_9ACTN|nr:hypothetical protein [Solirubrobacter phytolaccae]MDA0180223.1 hypothetical protein [Solirubrobacter phytolaccae]
MSHRITRAALGAVLAVGLLASPAAATTRVDAKLKTVERALDRATDRVADGEAAATQLTSVRRNVASAQKTALRKADVASLSAVARAQGRVVSATVGAFDGATGDNVTGLATTLKAALDGRDAIVAAAAGKTELARVVAQINRDAAGDAEDIADALADDELTDEARAALTAAATQVAATVTATGGTDTTTPTTPAADGDREDCPEGEGREAGAEPAGYGRGGRGQRF